VVSLFTESHITLDDTWQSNEDTNTSNGDVFDRIFGPDSAKQGTNATKRDASRAVRGSKYKVLGHSLQANGGGRRPKANKPPKPRLKRAHLQFITELLKDPSNQGLAYQRVYPNSGHRRAIEKASRLLRRPDIAAEMARRQSQIATKAVLTRARLEAALAEVFSFDFRRFYYPRLQEDYTPHPRAGEPKDPCDLDDEAARVLESYERSVGKFGAKVKMRTTPRLGAAELLAKLKGWVKDDGRPPIVANFNFDFGPRPVAGQRLPDVEAVPPQFYGAMGLRDTSIPAKPIPQTVDEHGDPVPPSMPAGYEPSRGVRIKSRGSELAADLDANLTSGGAT
jgi:hypothetical protein